MTNRNAIHEELNRIEQGLKELEIAYEQYFMGLEKREPARQRQELTKRMRRLVGKYIPQTDLRFRFQSISSRFNSYSGYWDRILRLIEDGKYERHVSKIQRQTSAPDEKAATAPPREENSVDRLYEKLAEAHQACNLKAPQREQVAGFLAKQREAIKQKFGDREVDFQVVTEGGRPKIKVRAKR